MKKIFSLFLLTLTFNVLASYNETFTLQGVSFTVLSPNNAAKNIVYLTTKGVKGNSQISVETDDVVSRAEVADINANGFPEIYIYTVSGGSGSYGGLIAYEASKKKLTSIYSPDLNTKASLGYMGHDEFVIVEDSLVRNFPVYKSTDSNNNPTGGMRQIQYKLIAGETGLLLKSDKVFDMK